MTLSSTVSRVDYIGNDATNVYPYTYRILSNTDLLVTVRNLSNVETTLTLTTDYTVSGVGAAGGGNVTLVNGGQAWLTSTGFLKLNFRLTIRRVRPLTQTTDIRNQGVFFPETHEDEFDRGIMIDQQFQDALSRCLKLKETEAGSAALTEIPVAADRASKVLAFNASGQPIAQSNVPTSAVAATAYAQTLLDDSTAAEARGTLVISAVVSPASVGSNQNDYAGLNVDGSIVLGRLTASAPVNFTGFTGGVLDKLLIVVNIGTNVITLTNEDAASTAANRILTPGGGSLPLSQNETASLRYDSVSSRWRVIASPLIGTAQIEDGAITTAKIADNAMTFAKTQNIATSRILGRTTTGSGNIEELTAGPGVTFGVGSVDADFATAAQMEVETANKVVPANLVNRSPSASKAWCQFTVTSGVPTLNVNYNVSSITDNGVGDFTINFTAIFSSANYAMAGMARGGATNLWVAVSAVFAPTASALRINTLQDSVTAVDPTLVAVCTFGDQ